MALKQESQWNVDDWKFEFDVPESNASGEGTLSPVGSRDDPFSSLIGFGSSLFEGLFGFLGGVFSGAVDFLGNTFGPVLEAVGNVVVSIVGGLTNIFSSVINFFRPGSSGPPPPIPNILNPFHTSLMETLQPIFDDIEVNNQALRDLNSQSEGLQGDLKDVVKEMDPLAPNTKAWRVQQDINELDRQWKVKAEENHRSLKKVTEDLAQNALLMFTAEKGAEATGDHFEVVSVGSGSSRRFELRKKGDWAGAASIKCFYQRILVGYDSGRLEWDYNGSGSVSVAQHEHWPVRFPRAGGNTFTLPGGTSGASVEVAYQLDPGTPKSDRKDISGAAIATGWRPITGFTFNFPAGGFSYIFKIGWDAANRGSDYGIRIFNKTKNTAINWDGPRSNVGPWTSLGDGYSEMILQGFVGSSDADVGNVIEFQTNTNAGSPAQRKVRDGYREVFWIEEKKETTT